MNHPMREPDNRTARARYVDECEENGEVPCIDARHHHWVCSDENENVCYCDKCGCGEY